MYKWKIILHFRFRTGFHFSLGQLFVWLIPVTELPTLPVSVYSAVQWGCANCLAGLKVGNFKEFSFVLADILWYMGATCIGERRKKPLVLVFSDTNFIPDLPFLDSGVLRKHTSGISYQKAPYRGAPQEMDLSFLHLQNENRNNPSPTSFSYGCRKWNELVERKLLDNDRVLPLPSYL